ncbi:hypothetical protein MMC14_006418 [Varicellaria rhodocarpa]|nr:hypothetical protein [Varicellaria rhodocarpa]
MPRQSLRKRPVRRDPYVDEILLFGEDSKLLEIDLEKYFVNPQAWEILSEEEKQHLRCLLPPQVALDENEAIPQEFLKYDSDWRNAIRQFKIDLQAGRYEAEWQEAAAKAMEERAAGKFDKFKEQEFEQFWGQKQKVPRNNIAGDVANVKLDDLISDDLFKVGDVWSFSKGNRGTANRGAMVIEKDVTIIAIQDGKLTFSIPPGQLKYHVRQAVPIEDQMEDAEHPEETGSADEEAPPIPTEEPTIFTPLTANTLGNKILEVDGRIQKPIVAYNAWMAFRCKRDNQDMGGLWDLREEYYNRNFSSE